MNVPAPHTGTFETHRLPLRGRIAEADAARNDAYAGQEEFFNMKGTVGGRRVGNRNVFTRAGRRKTSAWAEMQRKFAIAESKHVGAEMFARGANIGMRRDETMEEFRMRKLEIDINVKQDGSVKAEVRNPDAGMLVAW